MPLVRKSLLLLIAGVLSALVLHHTYLPLGFYGLAALTIGYRLTIFAGWMSFPRWPIKATAVLLAPAMVYFSFNGTVSLEGTSAFLVAAGLLKVLEVSDRRGGVVLIWVIFFLQASGFLFDQSFYAALNGVVSLWLATAAMVSLQASTTRGLPANIPVLRTTNSLMLWALPFMLLLYFVFPRVGPLWSVAVQANSATTGLSSRMSPGDIASLSQSDETAFRVTFDGVKPPQSQLYWSAMILANYDGRAWEVAENDDKTINWWLPSRKQVAAQNDDSFYRYDIMMAPTGQQYLFALSEVVAVDAPATNTLGLTEEGVLLSKTPIFQSIGYGVASATVATSLSNLSQPLSSSTQNNFSSRDQFLQLPRFGNPQARALGEQLQQETNSVSAFARSFMDLIRNQNFVYTLTPPVYGDNDIDAFLFEQRRGFCAHYASALAFTARASGIPARVIGGYQGGEWHPDGFLIVRQYDAHAWVELWENGQWQRFDPTAAVAPDRIEFGLQRALEQEGSFLRERLLSAQRMRQVSWFNKVMLQVESLDYYWTRFVLGYKGNTQRNFLKRWLGADQFADGLIYIAYALVLSFLFTAAWLWRQQRLNRPSALIRAWQHLQQVAAEGGVDSKHGTAPTALLTDIKTNYPVLNAQCEVAQKAFEEHLYRDVSSEKKTTRELALVKQLKALSSRIRALSKLRNR
ncbi:MAG: DUF3488 and transglutaminase-like domain-containing protein [Oleibacter sp.]|nr:DUF3488 and transglutaminase-like domain-containing protein [Thalassolituus sp.]